MKSRPTFLDALLRRASGNVAELVIGDLDEEWPERVTESGTAGAMWWYLRTVVSTTLDAATRDRSETMNSHQRRSPLAGWLMEFRYEARAMLHAPLWSSLAIATVSIGMVFAVLVFALAESMRTELVPFQGADRLFTIAESNGLVNAVADPTLRQLQERTNVFEAVGAWTFPGDANLNRADADPTVVRTASILPGTFDMLGYAPIVGRAFTAADEEPIDGTPALISYGFWQRGFSGSASALGANININGRPFTVVGILSPDARVPNTSAQAPPDLWMPILRLPSLATDPGLRYQVVVRAAQSLEVETLAAAADQIMDELRGTLPQWRSDPSWHMQTRALRAELEGDGAMAIRALGAAATLLLVLAAANLFALTAARLQSRSREFTVHSALGAPPTIAMRRLLAQNFLIAVAGTLVATFVGSWLLGVFRAARPDWIPAAQFARIGAAETALTGFAAVLLCLLVAFLSAKLQPRLGDGLEPLRARGPLRRWKLMARGLVVVETALVVSLAIGAGLITQSLVNLQSVDVAVPLENRLAARVSLAGGIYGDSVSVRRFTDAVLERLDGAPGIEAAAAATSPPFARAGWNFVILDGHDPADGQLPTTELAEVTPGYFEVLGLPLASGRGLQPADYAPGAEAVVVINETLAAMFDGPAVGRTLNFTDAPLLRVVGVVRNSPAGRLDEPPGPWVYLADMDNAFPWTMSTRWFVLRLADGAQASVAATALRAAVLEADDSIPLHPPRLLSEMRNDLLHNASFRGVLFGFLGAVGLVLGAAGIFGVVSHTLASARRETGIRLALGATRSRVFAGTVATETGAVLLGATFGVIAAWQIGLLLASFLFGVSAADVSTYGAALAAVGVVAAIAIAVPAFRSASADPASSLRND